jgi:DNA-binding GntR family transcriptional regulator
MSRIEPASVPSLHLGDQLRRGIEEDILAGRLAPGDRLDERALAARYRVSRTPVREALLQLASTGLIEMRPRQGAVVATMSVGRLLQMLEVMCLLEAQCARLAARRMTAAERDALAVIQARAAAVLPRGDVAAFHDCNWRLHQAIFAGSHNPYLAEQARTLRLRLHPYRCYLLIAMGRVAIAHGEHDRIICAIREGREDDAFNAMYRHLTIDSDRLTDLLAQLPLPVRDDALMGAPQPLAV